MSELQRRVESLRKPLLLAARDGFAGLEDAALGAALRAACGKVIAAAADDGAAFEAWRGALAAFESLERDRQMIEVARGLRLCQGLAGAVPAERRRARTAASPLEQPTDSLPGIGAALSERLAERGIETVEDLMWLVPRRYDDVRLVQSVDEVAADPDAGERITVAGESTSVRYVRRGRRGWVDVRLGGGDAEIVVRWFNAYPGMSKRFEAGSQLVLSGRLGVRGGALELANPDVLAITSPDGEEKLAAPGILPRYSEIPGVPATKLRKACQAAVERGASLLVDVVPPAVAARRQLPSLTESLTSLHAPPPTMSVDEVRALNLGRSEWHRRLAYEELFVLGLVIARRRAEARAEDAVGCPEIAPAEVTGVLPFAPTGAQQRAIATIARDVADSVPMNRLLQGDVGSGKTAVAFAAALQVARAGRQVALMAPTEILAEQHHAALSPWCQRAGLRLALLTASTPRGVRSSTLSLLAAGEIDLLVGTHSLIAESVTFARLGLAIVDEQHRFGVAQRVRLRAKGDGSAPHLLVMTATPIPRTLALTAYGDLDVSVIDEMPPGREPARTQVLVGDRRRAAAYQALMLRLERGERAFVVCPLVEPSEDDSGRDWADATSVAAELARTLAPHRVELVHGRLATDARDAAMDAFRRGDAAVLVATTVVEVGVDVPEATIIVIEDADRFGLAQLHQLRGRVGRGGGASECVLLCRGSSTDVGAERIEVMVSTSDGFRIAEEDLRLRGPGEILGVRQAGLPRLRFGDLEEHGELLLQARSDADEVVSTDPQLSAPEHLNLRELLERRLAEVEAYGAEGG